MNLNFEQQFAAVFSDKIRVPEKPAVRELPKPPVEESSCKKYRGQ